MTVQKVKGGWKAYSSTKGALSKKPKTKVAAQRQHRAIMASKARRKKKKKRK
jgi:hypothetical protein